MSLVIEIELRESAMDSRSRSRQLSPEVGSYGRLNTSMQSSMERRMPSFIRSSSSAALPLRWVPPTSQCAVSGHGVSAMGTW